MKADKLHRCDCCRQDMLLAEIASWVGTGPELKAVCDNCCRFYFSARHSFPDHSFDQALELARMLHLQENLPKHLQPKLKRLLILLQNKSKRAKRLLEMADQHGLSLQQLLALI